MCRTWTSSEREKKECLEDICSFTWVGNKGRRGVDRVQRHTRWCLTDGQEVQELECGCCTMSWLFSGDTCLSQRHTCPNAAAALTQLEQRLSAVSHTQKPFTPILMSHPEDFPRSRSCLHKTSFCSRTVTITNPSHLCFSASYRT